MIRLNGPWVAVLVLALWPAGAGAQPAAQSLDQLRVLVKVGEVVVVTDETGRETKGKVAEVGPSSLFILTKARTRDAAGRESWGWTDRRMFDAPTIRKIEHRDALWNGTLIGLGIGVGLAALSDALYCRPDGGCEGVASMYLAFGGIGATAGVGLDALIDGHKVLYRSPSQVKGVTLSPVFSRERTGMLASIRF